MKDRDSGEGRADICLATPAPRKLGGDGGLDGAGRVSFFEALVMLGTRDVVDVEVTTLSRGTIPRVEGKLGTLARPGKTTPDL